MSEKQERRTCCLCGEAITGHGHNPAPLADAGEACDPCYWRVVIARLELVRQLDRQDNNPNPAAPPIILAGFFRCREER